MSRASICWFTAAFLAVVVLGGGRASTADSPDYGSPGAIAAVHPDPSGATTSILTSALEALAAERWDAAADAIVELLEEHGDALVPVPVAQAGPAPLHWPARRVVEVLAPKLPAEQRRRVGERWRVRARALVRGAERGSEPDLDVLADAWAVTPEGAEALVLLARRDLGAGRFSGAVERLERWLLARPDASAKERAGVLLTLIDARAALEDESALDAIVERFPDASRVAVSTSRGRTSPRLKARQHRVRIRSRLRRSGGAGSSGRVLPRDPVVLWVRPHDRSNLITGPDTLPYSARIRAAAAYEGDDLYLHDGQVVSCVAPYTGRERWRFPPPTPEVWDFNPREVYEEPALPLHAISVTDTFVVTVVGTPAATGSFVINGAQYQSADLARENQARLVVLERTTGRLRWSSGSGRETHPILGDPDLACASPPLVDGDDVYALFARRRGASEIYAACLDLATGAPRWVTFLARGESGRTSYDASDGLRFVSGRILSVPWGAPPALAGGELCVLPHAGFAAGLDAATGRRSWIRPLPRYAGSGRGRSGLDGFAGHDAPLAWGGLWILAPFDASRLVALESRTGRWRWHAPGVAPVSEAPPWRHLHGVSLRPDDGPWVRLQGTRPVLLPLRQPLRPESNEAEPPPGVMRSGGRAYDAGSHLVWLGGEPVDQTGAPGHLLPALHAVPWDGTRVRTQVLEDRRLPFFGAVQRCGPLWLLVGDSEVAALAARHDVEAWLEATLESEGEPGVSQPGAARVAALALRAHLSRAADAMEEALRAAATSHDPSARAVVVEAAATCVEDDVRSILDLGPSLLALAGGDPEPESVLAAALERPSSPLDPARRVELLDEWIRIGGGASLVEVKPGVAIRGDLVAGSLLRRLRSEPNAGGALFERDRTHLARIRALGEASEDELREAIRLAVATPAAAEGRRQLKDRLIAEGRFAEAADVAADLRLAMVPHGALAGTALRRNAARLQREEARLRLRAGDAADAQALSSDLRRWAARPEQMRPSGGDPTDGEGEALARALAWRPARGDEVTLDLGHAELDASEIRGVIVPHLEGPGAAIRSDRFLVFRGLCVEIWSRRSGERVAELPGAGEGWFGGTLQELPRWLPEGGIRVTSVVAREPADRAGLRPGDWIVDWAGAPVRTSSAFMHAIARSPPGLPIDVRVLRRGHLVLDRFVPGRRPAGDGRVIDRDALYADPEGRVLLPGRVDLAWADLAAATRTPVWSWRDPGVVSGVRVRGGTAYVTIRRVREADVIVAVDLATGRERWRRDVTGSVSHVGTTGSAVLVTTSWPARVYVVDRHDGTVRARVDALPRRVRPRSRTWTRSPVSVPIHGRLWWIAKTDGHQLRVLNTTTAAIEWQESPETGRRFEPLIAGDGVVAVARSHGSLEVLAPDPVTGGVAWRVRWGQEDASHPEVPIDADARLLVNGWTLWVIGYEGGSRTTVEVYELVPAALGPRASRGEVSWSRAVRRRPRAHVGPFRTGRPYVLDSRVTAEGLLVSTAVTGDRPARGAAWVPKVGSAKMWLDPISQERGVIQIRRHPPSRVGDRLFVPIDQGVLVVPLESAE